MRRRLAPRAPLREVLDCLSPQLYNTSDILAKERRSMYQHV